MATPARDAPLAPYHMSVPRTARYYVIGTPSAMVRDVWIACHGFSQLAADFARPFRGLADDSRLILVPEALSRYYIDTSPERTRTSRVGATWMTREDRDADIADVVTYLDALYERWMETLATEGASRDRMRVHALGFSQGAPAVSRWAARGRAVVDHIVAWGHGIPPEVNLRALHERHPSLSIDMVYGTRDKWIQPEGVVEQEAVLVRSAVPHRMITFEGGHTLNTEVLRELMER